MDSSGSSGEKGPLLSPRKRARGDAASGEYTVTESVDRVDPARDMAHFPSGTPREIFLLDGKTLTPEQLWAIGESNCRLDISHNGWARIGSGAHVVEKVLAEHSVVCM
jgi:hypothetical protein